MESLKTNWQTSVNWKNLIAGLNKYTTIMCLFENAEIKDWTDPGYRDFRRRYNHFYRMRRNEAFQQPYYNLLLSNKHNKALSFEECYTALFQLTGRYEASFASKLLATVRPDMPVWDSEVLKKLGKKEPASYDSDRLAKSIDCYAEIQDWYQNTITSALGAEMINAFDAIVGPSSITEAKKIDLMLWQKDR